MLILLPTSESKSGRVRGRRLDLESVSFPELTDTRRLVADTLARTSAHPDAAARLGVSPNLTAEIARNLALDTVPSLPAGRVYTGVLYDALDLASLDPAAARRANRWLVVVSALFGAVRPRDAIVPYRLSMSASLDGLGPLAPIWRPLLDQVLPTAAGRGLVVDCRSSTYAAAWTPAADLAPRWVQIRVPGATHMAKHTRGLVARQICQDGSDPRTVPLLAEALARHFRVELSEPARPGRPWVLDVHPPNPVTTLPPA